MTRPRRSPVTLLLMIFHPSDSRSELEDILLQKHSRAYFVESASKGTRCPQPSVALCLETRDFEEFLALITQCTIILDSMLSTMDLRKNMQSTSPDPGTIIITYPREVAPSELYVRQRSTTRPLIFPIKKSPSSSESRGEDRDPESIEPACILPTHVSDRYSCMGNAFSTSLRIFSGGANRAGGGRDGHGDDRAPEHLWR
jgi:hypothetical protein